ncbi:hypothetical protein [Pseudonocardia xishanensis]|uniref:Uncharacterized protein n=1 Tax=Pseudonocardia xishanensis TaxID=630995 RepID=A0ABP8RKE8_9PSEU
MGVLGQMFPGPKIADEAGESGTGEPVFRLARIDLDTNTVTLVRSGDATEGVEAAVGADVDADGD